MFVSGMHVVGPCWSSSDNEEYFGNPDSFEEQQDQQEFANKGKYSMAYLDVLFTLNRLLILHVSNFDHPKDFLVFDDILLDSYGLIAHG
jgi:hypothetical protein